MKVLTYLLLTAALVLGGVAAALWLRPTPGMSANIHERRFGLFENREVVGLPDNSGTEYYVVEDKDCRQLFAIPLRNCMIDTRYRNGRLRFRENGTGREGFIDRNGIITFFDSNTRGNDRPEGSGHNLPENTSAAQSVQQTATGNTANTVENTDVRMTVKDNPFYKEAQKVLSGSLNEDDAEKRRVILNYCEHFRTAYTTKDIDFLRQVFSDKALIIVGNTIKTRTESGGNYLPEDKVTYNVRSKRSYIARLTKAFEANKKIGVKFENFRIMRHPTIDGIYGVSLRQQYSSDRYSDDGYLFLLWDFRDKSMPLIHVRTWQPATAIKSGDDAINLMDFNFQ